MPIEIDTWMDSRCLVIEVSGEIDIHTCDRLRRALFDASTAGSHRLVIELSGLDFIDSSGLGVLVGAMKQARIGGGQLVLVGTPDRLKRQLEITGLIKVMPLLESLKIAFSYLAQYVRRTRTSSTRH